MEIEILKDSKEKLEIQLKGENHTFCNILRKEIWKDKTVKLAAYQIEHSLTGNPVLTIEGKNPKKSLKEAIKNLKKTNKEFLTKFNKSL